MVKARRVRKGKIFRGRKVKPVELLGFAAIGLFLVLIFYLALAPVPNISTHRITTDATTLKETRPGATTILGKAAIVDQLGLKSPNQPFIDEAKFTLERAGFEVDIYPPQAVTVNLYKTVSAKGYRLILFRVHMGVNNETVDKPVGLFTSEPYSQFSYQADQLRDWVVPAKSYGVDEYIFAVSPKFIKEATVIDYPGTLIILSGCFGLYSRPLPEAFLERGASVVIGWNGPVGVDYVDRATMRLLIAICSEKLSIERAVEDTMLEVGPDPDSGSVLGYQPPSIGGASLATYLQTRLEMGTLSAESIRGKPAQLISLPPHISIAIKPLW